MADHPSTSNNTTSLPSTANQSENDRNDHVTNSDNPNSTNHNPSDTEQSQNPPATNVVPTTTATGQVAMGYPPAYGQPYYPYGPHSGPAPPIAVSGGVVGERSGSPFIRGFLAMLLTLTVISCVASITTWLILRPQLPIFRVESLTVSGLNVSGPEILQAQWEARLVAENPNKKLRVYLDQIQGYVYHKEEFLSSAAVDPAFLPTEGREEMLVRLRSAGDGAQRTPARWVSGDVAGELRGGAVVFNLRLLILATFRSGQWWTKHSSMKVFCDDLRVGFAAGNGSAGVLDVGGSPKRCVVY